MPELTNTIKTVLAFGVMNNYTGFWKFDNF